MKVQHKILLIISLLIIAQTAFCQENNAKKKKEHSPRKATIYSAVLPGAGQFYNKKYWKIPIAYIGIGAFSYFTIKNQKEFNRYKTAVLLRQDGKIDEFTDANGNQIYNETALINYMDKYRKNRDLNIIGAFVVYAIQIVDANVDANLFDFDVSDQLSIKIIPNSINNYCVKEPATGISCFINF